MRYDEYFELSEKHSWRTTDLDWRELTQDAAAGRVTEFDKRALAGTAVIESGVPHYGEVWSMVEGLHKEWDLWQFTSLWTGEESRHSFALRKACDVLALDEHHHDLTAVSEFAFARTQKASCSTDCYRTVPGMLAYTVIQELATNKFYAMAQKRTKSPFLKNLFGLIAGDELRHYVFYRDVMKELHTSSTDQAWYCDRVFEATRAFKMPHLHYNLQVPFFEMGDWSIGAAGKLAFKAQLMRCFSFDAGLLARMLAAKADAQINAKRTAGPTAQPS